MERLTKRNSVGIAVYKHPYECERCNEPIYRLPDYGNGSPTDRLYEYEDLAEQGRLLVLDTREAAQSLIDAQPTIEAVPVVHGEWIYENYTWHCGVCGFHPFKGYIPKEPGFNFCPNCRAKMDGGSD